MSIGVPISLRVGDEPQLGPEPPLDWVAVGCRYEQMPS